jgi:glycosyltransferase involved in cell wall biosynthesis
LEKIGIGITTYNRERILKSTIEKIKKFTKPPYKLVIVDDGSVTPFTDATYRFSTNQGSPISKNKCIELLEGCEHIFLFDDDTYPIKDGWEKAYINSNVPHLNYTFKYAFNVVNGVRHLENPNGCMMYLHRSVIDTVGGFDTGFIKYGYWHGAFSNRVYNSGLIPHPFIDIVDSKEYIYCLDEKPKTHTTSRTDRSKYLRQNKQRYFDKLKSKEYINYKDIKIWYSNPYSTSKNIGKALNDFCELIPDKDWICLQDGDMIYLTPEWGKQIEDVVKSHGDKFGLIGCMTNRLGRSIQRVGEMDSNHEMLYHYEIAKELRDKNYGVVEDITKKKYVAGLFMLFPKLLWNKVNFKENNAAFDDVFSKEVTRKGYKLGLMKGLYVYHFYRGWNDTNPSKDRAHLL